MALDHRYGLCVRSHDEKDYCPGHLCVVCDKVFYCYQDPKHECSPRPTGGYELGIDRTPTYGKRLDDAEFLNHLTDGEPEQD